LIGTSNVRKPHSEPRLVQGGGGTSVKITREWFGEPTVADPVSPR